MRDETKSGCEVDYLTASEGENSRYNPVHLVTSAKTIFVTTHHSLLRDVKLLKKNFNKHLGYNTKPAVVKDHLSKPSITSYN